MSTRANGGDGMPENEVISTPESPHTADLIALVQKAGFAEIRFSQAIFNLSGDDASVWQVHDGYGNGAFVVLSATI